MRGILAICLLVGGNASALEGEGTATEEAGRFVNELRERGYYDTALEYLEGVKKNPKVGEQYKQSLDYLAGLILVDMSRSGMPKAARAKTLDDAFTRFDRFLKEHENHPLTDDARTQLANLMVERGRRNLELAENSIDAQKEKLASGARELFRDAKKAFEETEEKCIKAHRAFPRLIPRENTAQIEARDKVRKTLLRNRLMIAAVAGEIAKTYPPDSEEYRRAKIAAAAKYKELHDKYGAVFVVPHLHPMPYQGVEEYEKLWSWALAKLDTLPGGIPAFRQVRNKARALAMEAGVELKKYEECIKLYDEWRKVSENERKDPEGLTIRFFAAEAMLAQDREPGHDKTANQTAKQLFQIVASVPSDYQERAKKRLAEMTDDKGEPNAGEPDVE